MGKSFSLPLPHLDGAAAGTTTSLPWHDEIKARIKMIVESLLHSISASIVRWIRKSDGIIGGVYIENTLACFSVKPVKSPAKKR